MGCEQLIARGAHLRSRASAQMLHPSAIDLGYKMAVVPNVVAVSYSDLDVNEIVKGILRTAELPSSLPLYDENVKTFPWKIETKYYTADIHICTVVNDQFGSSSEILENMQALVTHFDSQKEATFNRVKMLHSLISGYEPDVRLLVCNDCSDSTPVTRTTIQSWCLQNGYELVEMNPEETSDTDDDFAETTGMDRVIQALHSHMWSNLVLKDKPSLFPSNMGKRLADKDGPATDTNSSSSTSHVKEDNDCADKGASGDSAGTTDEDNLSVKDEDLEAILNHLDSDDTQSFESLFERFQIMKDRAKNMAFEERKGYAEQVAVAFWRAIGGDEEEIAGLNLDN